MREAALLLSVLAAFCIGFAVLALSQDRHWQRITGTRLRPPGAMLSRTAGFSLLMAGFFLAIVLDGPGFGSLLGVAMLTSGALIVVCMLTWRSHWLRPLACYPETCFLLPVLRHAHAEDSIGWLKKPLASGGGRGIRLARARRSLRGRADARTSRRSSGPRAPSATRDRARTHPASAWSHRKTRSARRRASSRGPASARPGPHHRRPG